MNSQAFRAVNADRQIRSPRSPSSRRSSSASRPSSPLSRRSSSASQLPTMADPNKSAPTFSFGGFGLGGASSSSPSQPSSDASKPAGGIFGSASNPPSTSGNNLFGNTSTAGGGSTFGAPWNSSQTPTFSGGSGSNVFGGGNKPSATSFFGQVGSQGSQASSTTAPTNSFLGFSTPNKPAESTAIGQGQAPNPSGGASVGGNVGGLFGNAGSTTPSLGQTSTTTPTSKPTTDLFNNSTTPAGPPPNASTGGGGSSLFNKPAIDSTNLFGTKDPSSRSQLNLQSGAGKLTGFSFGSSKPQDSSSTNTSMQPASNMFGSTPSAGGSDIFGKKPAQLEGSLFQNLDKSQDSGATSQQPQSEASKTSNLFSLGGQSSASTSAAPTTTASPFLFPKATQAQSSAPANPMASSSTAASAFSLFNKPSSSALSNPSTSASLFPSIGQTHDKAPASTSAEAAGTTAPTGSNPTLTSTLFSNAGKSATTFATPQAPSQPTASSIAQGHNLGASTAGPAPPAQSRLKNKSMDDIITRWASDLSKYQKEFQAQAEKVATWDRMLVENSEKIQKLYGSTLEAERTTTEVERQLTAVESDQVELAQWLDYYEKEVDSMISTTFGQEGTLSGPDQERERTYQLASRLSERLDDMGKDLTSMIEEINDVSSTLSKNNKADDPLTQVVRVLNSHLTQLQQIDQGTAALQLKVRDAQRTSHMLGPSHGLSGPSSDGADAFYRSYMGRR